MKYEDDEWQDRFFAYCSGYDEPIANTIVSETFIEERYIGMSFEEEKEKERDLLGRSLSNESCGFSYHE